MRIQSLSGSRGSVRPARISSSASPSRRSSRGPDCANAVSHCLSSLAKKSRRYWPIWSCSDSGSNSKASLIFPHAPALPDVAQPVKRRRRCRFWLDLKLGKRRRSEIAKRPREHAERHRSQRISAWKFHQHRFQSIIYPPPLLPSSLDLGEARLIIWSGGVYVDPSDNKADIPHVFLSHQKNRAPAPLALRESLVFPLQPHGEEWGSILRPE